MVRVAVELSGEHPTLPRAEVEALLRSLGLLRAERARERGGGAHSVGVAMFEVQGEVPWDLLARRLAYARRVLEVVATSRPRDLEAAAASIPVEGRSFALRGPRDRVLSLGRILKERGLRVSLDAPDVTFHILREGGVFHLARERAAVDRSAYEARRPAKRPFFKPGVVLPRLARALVNLAEPEPGGVLLDPFCGTGSLPVEAALCGLRAVGVDAQWTMVVGSRRNLLHLGLDGSILWGDARRLPLADGSVAAVVADPPYGRSARVVGAGRDALYREALEETARVLRPGGRAVVLSSGPGLPEVSGLVREERYAIPVHRSLVRHVAVLRKKG